MGLNLPGLRPAAAAAGLAVILSGCLGPAPRPGWASAGSPSGWSATLQQPGNPAAVSVQRVREEFTLPKLPPDSFSKSGRHGETPAASGPVHVVRTAETTLGPAHRDTGADVAARLASFRPIQWLGALVFLAGVAAAVWPPARALVGSLTTAAAMASAGLGLVVLPSLLVGREAWILGLAGVGSGAWFLAHRHGRLRGELAAVVGQRQGSGRRKSRI